MVFRLFKQFLAALRIWYYGSSRAGSANQDDPETVVTLPETCLRGLRKPDWVDEQSLIQTAAFIPDPRTAGTREDGGRETSVNWEDDAQVESFTLTNKSNAQHGAARISTSQINETADMVAMSALPLSCERRRRPDNQYHGNIVYSSKVSKALEKMLAAALALRSRYVPPR